MRFTENHEWLRLDDDHVTVGITKHASEQLGDVVFIEIKEPGQTLVMGDEIAVIESVKAASEIGAPFDGEIISVNEAVIKNPTLVNEDPGGEGWFVKLKPADLAVLDSFMDEKAYTALVGEDT